MAALIVFHQPLALLWAIVALPDVLESLMPFVRKTATATPFSPTAKPEGYFKTWIAFREVKYDG